MTALDLTEVDPLNWERAQARARAVQAYLALPKRNGVERDRLAAELGISPNLFSRLVAAWKAGKGVDGLMVNGRKGFRTSTRLDRRSAEIMQSAIAFHGVNATLKEVKAAVLNQCAKESLKAPSTATIHTHLVRSRSEQQATNVQPLIVVGEVLVMLPCQDEAGEIVQPKLVLAVEVESRQIVAFRVVPHTENADYLELLAEVRRENRTSPISIDAEFRKQFSTATAKSLRLSFQTRAYVRRWLSRTLGSRLHNLPVVYRAAATATPERVLIRRKGKSVSLGVAIQAVGLAVQEHNARWRGLAAATKCAA